MGMYNHPWAQTLLGLTNLLEDCNSPQDGAASLEALEAEGLTRLDVERMVTCLEGICDVSFRG